MAAAGGLEGAAYGLTGSDSLSEVPQNVAIGAGFGAAMPIGLHGAGYGAKWLARPLTDKVTQYIGKQKLTKQLAKGAGFEDVNLGNVDDDLATRLNQVRNAENVSPVGNAGVTVPAKNVAHIFNRRIIKNKYTPQEAGETINNALFSRDSRVIRGKTPDYQVVLDTNDIPNAAIVGRNPNTNGIMVKTGYRADNVSGLSEGYKGGDLAGTGNPASTPIQQNRSAASISTLQVPSYKNSIVSNAETVNPAFQRSFVEALADEGKRRTMRNAVLSGAEDLSERARILSDRMAAAQTAQDIFESKLGKGLTQVGGATATTSSFWSGITSPLAAAGVVGGAFNPMSLALTAGGLSAKALMRAVRRNAGRRIADGVIRTPIEVNINPNLSAALSAEMVNNYNNR